MSRYFVLLFAALASGCATYHTAAPGGVDTFYPVNGHKMHVMIEGSGPVVILSGGGGINDPYVGLKPVINGLKDKATVMLYERPGFGLSEETTIPRTADTESQEMDELFAAAGLRAPYILVGHSMASLEVLRYAQRFPSKVRAVVLLEGAPPKFYLTMKMPSDFEQWVYTSVFGMAKGNAFKVKSLVESAEAVIRHGSIGDIPLYYFYAGANGIEGWVEAQKEFSGLSNQPESVFFQDANHFIFETHAPEIVAKVKSLL